MARLPDSTALGERPVPNASNAVAGYEPRASSVGAQISGAGREIQETAAIFLQANEQQDRMTAQAAANRLSASALDLQSGEGGFAGVKGGNAAKPDFVKTYEGKFTTVQNEVRESLSNENQKRIFDQHATPTSLHFKGGLLHHQAQQTNAFNAQTENDTIDLARRSIFQSPGNPQALQAGFTQINWAIDQKAKREGWAPETVADTKLKYAERVFEDVVGMDVERDPASALALMNKRMGIGGPAENSGNAAVDALGPDKLIMLRARAQSHVVQAENRARLEQDKTLRIAEDAFKGLSQFVLSGDTVDQGYERTLLAETAGTHFEPQVRALIAMSYAGGGYGSRSLPEQKEMLRRVDESMAQGTNPAAVLTRGKMREITANQEAAYKANPWAAAARFAKLPSVPEEQITAGNAPQVIANRLALLPGVEAASGKAESPLQPGEVRGLVEALATLPPAKAAWQLGQFGEQLSAPRLAVFADQVVKNDRPAGLAMKFGGNLTTGGVPVGQMMLLGAQYLKDKTIKLDEAEIAGTWRKEISALIRGSIGDDKIEDEAIDAAIYTRAYLASDQTPAPGFDKIKASSAKAVALTVGIPIERAGTKTIIPRGMDEDAFNAKLKTFTPEVLKGMAPVFYVRGKPITPEKLSGVLGMMGMTRAGKNAYFPVSGGAVVTTDPDGQVPLRLQIQ
jgi:hypothetical protein